MSFADEPVGYHERSFDCGWSERPQTAVDIAARAREFARRLGDLDPAYGRIRPDPGMRAFRAGDRGPIVDMTTAELADLIERRGRFDPPRLPAPVSPTGYSVLYRNSVLGRDPSFLSVSIKAGQYGSGWVENTVCTWPDTEHRVWRDPELGLQVLGAMVEVWAPEWACAYALPTGGPRDDDEIGLQVRPWLAWTAKPLQPRADPAYGRPYPFPFPLDAAGPPAEESSWHGGVLQFWP